MALDMDYVSIYGPYSAGIHTFECSRSNRSRPELITLLGCVDGTGLDRSIVE